MHEIEPRGQRKSKLLGRILQPTSRNLLIAAFVAVTVLTAGALLWRSHASGFFASADTSTGALSGNATLVSEVNSATGKVVQFNAPSSNTGGGGTSTSSCPLPKYPSPSCTGVPSGTTFSKTVNGDYTSTTNGEVIDGWHITGDLNIHATNVVIKNSQIDGTVTNDGIANTSFAISDSTAGTATCATGGQPSLWGHDFTATRVLLQGHQDAVDMGGDNVTVTDSYLHPCFLPASIVGSDGYHTDGVQDLCNSACSNLSLTHNTVDAKGYYNNQAMGNSALNLGSQADGLNMRSVTLKNNLFMGGGYTTDLRWDAGPNWVVSGNAWVSGAYAYAPISTEGTCSNQTWSGNTLVSIDANYAATSTVGPQSCVD